MKSCSNCKWEPYWERADYFEHGHCRFPYSTDKLPECVIVSIYRIRRYSDGSGVMRNCMTWEAKQDP